MLVIYLLFFFFEHTSNTVKTRDFELAQRRDDTVPTAGGPYHNNHEPYTGTRLYLSYESQDRRVRQPVVERIAIRYEKLKPSATISSWTLRVLDELCTRVLSIIIMTNKTTHVIIVIIKILSVRRNDDLTTFLGRRCRDLSLFKYFTFRAYLPPLT